MPHPSSDPRPTSSSSTPAILAWFGPDGRFRVERVESGQLVRYTFTRTRTRTRGGYGV